MPEEIMIEITEPIKKQFYRTWRGLCLIAASVLILIAAIFSWWLATGKLSSAAARLDTMIYTVGSDFPARLKKVFVLTGDQVEKGQPLGVIESPEYAGQLQSAAQELANLRSLAGLPQQAVQNDSAGNVEKEAVSKLAQARFDEERLQKVYQDAVADHVRGLLIMRSTNMSNQTQYSEAVANELRLRRRMEEALENFEKASKLRASLDQALTKIKMAILSARKSSGMNQIIEKASRQENTFAGEATLSAPVQGSVFRISAQPGEILHPGEIVFYILPDQTQQAGERWIQAWFSPADKEKIKVGQPVSIKFPEINLVVAGKVEVIGDNEESLPDTLTEEAHAATLSRPAAVYLQGLYIPVKISLNNPDKTNALEPGTAAICQIQTHYIWGNDWF